MEPRPRAVHALFGRVGQALETGQIGALGPPWERRHAVMPNRGRCEFVYLCARLYVTNGRSDHLFNIVIRIGGAPNGSVLIACGARSSSHAVLGALQGRSYKPVRYLWPQPPRSVPGRADGPQVQEPGTGKIGEPARCGRKGLMGARLGGGRRSCRICLLWLVPESRHANSIAA